ncbi:MAG TPA: NAD(P)-dependent oxidoreductase, partial [Nitrospirae bacterium]|nr:NAD(P)-dependent oxidoreductase [Nitrospirota bacterium]
MNVLVTGSSGFVGRNLTERLLEKGYKVYGFDRLLMRGFRVRNHRNFNQRKVDLHSFSSVLRACRTIQNVKYVFHTVAIQPSG